MSAQLVLELVLRHGSPGIDALGRAACTSRAARDAVRMDDTLWLAACGPGDARRIDRCEVVYALDWTACKRIPCARLERHDGFITAFLDEKAAIRHAFRIHGGAAGVRFHKKAWEVAA